jgi:hypothetical protein
MMADSKIFHSNLIPLVSFQRELPPSNSWEQPKGYQMAFNDVVAKAQTYFPSLQIKYKDQSIFMQILGKIMFFAPNFMTTYVTTLGNTVYFPSQQYIQNQPRSACDVFIHECVHIYDEKKIGFPFQLGYTFPQILAPFMWLLLFFFPWWAVLALFVLFLLPLPAPWRAFFEKRAYFVQMYASYTLYKDDPEKAGLAFASWFRNGAYYWMWPFEQDILFVQEAVNIKAGKPNCASDPVLLQMVNNLIAAAKV